MNVLKLFKIAENSKRFDVVELLYDELNKYYTVRWKWTTMKCPNEKVYINYEDAIKKYEERKYFAILCN